MSETREAFIADLAIATNELDDFFFTFMEASDQGSRPIAQRWRVSEAKARKLLRELAERLI